MFVVQFVRERNIFFILLSFDMKTSTDCMQVDVLKQRIGKEVIYKIKCLDPSTLKVLDFIYKMKCMDLTTQNAVDFMYKIKCMDSTTLNTGDVSVQNQVYHPVMCLGII